MRTRKQHRQKKCVVIVGSHDGIEIGNALSRRWLRKKDQKLKEKFFA